MAGYKELGNPKNYKAACKELVARAALKKVRSQGHEYVDLRKDGKAYVFFCTLCLAPCFGERVLYDHLRGSLHRGRLVPAKATLLKPNPWPFNDGMLFFHTSSLEENKGCSSLDLNNGGHGKELAIVSQEKHVTSVDDSQSTGYDDQFVGSYDKDETGESEDEDKNADGVLYDLVVPGVLVGDEVLDIGVRLVGTGKIAARFFLKDEVPDEVSRIWCEWFGNDQEMDPENASEHDFAVIIFAYDTILGRNGLVGDIKYLLSSSTWEETSDSKDDGRKKRKRSCSDPGDVSESSNQDESSSEASPSLGSSSSRMLLECQDDDQLLISKFMASRTNRKELRRQETVASKKICGICQHKMLAGKDVAAFFNRKTGKIVCSSRNQNGAFHIFHISCLIHWILLCECEIYKQQLGSPKMKQKTRRKTGRKCSKLKEVAEVKVLKNQIDSVFCPDCQGSGVHVEGDKLERPYISLTEIFHYKLKVTDGHRDWMKSPEMLENCSIGFHFPPESEEQIQEHVKALKLLRFYRADL